MNVGILGGGQLGRMLALAAYPLADRCFVYDPDPACCAGEVAVLTVGSFYDDAALAKWARTCDVVTFESENIAASVIERIQAHVSVFPGLLSLSISQDRLVEKQRLQKLGIETVPFSAIDSLADLNEAIVNLRFPVVLKTRRGGYDGKGQKILRCADDVETAWRELGETNLIAEGFASFQREVSLIGVRDQQGGSVSYGLVANVHQRGVLRVSRSLDADPLQSTAEKIVRHLMDDLGHVGALALEFFDVDGRLVANEIAPRVHNTGHWTIEGACTSQFENHIRAITGRPLGATQTRGICAMVNFIGGTPDLNVLLGLEGVHAHFYGKAGRPGRKIGHATVVATTDDERERAVKFITDLVRD